MVYKLASSFTSECKDDLYQVGVVGLINAYKNYNSTYDTKFSTYAYDYVLGEMRKYARENKGVKISRDIVYLSSRLDRLIELLCQKYNRMPTTKELSSEVGVEEWKIVEALNARNCVKSLDEPLNTDGKEMTVIDVVPAKIPNVDSIELSEMINMLSRDEQRIVLFRYFYGKSQEETAKLLGYSQAKVSREEQRILDKLRDYYN